MFLKKFLKYFSWLQKFAIFLLFWVLTRDIFLFRTQSLARVALTTRFVDLKWSTYHQTTLPECFYAFRTQFLQYYRWNIKIPLSMDIVIYDARYIRTLLYRDIIILKIFLPQAQLLVSNKPNSKNSGIFCKK